MNLVMYFSSSTEGDRDAVIEVRPFDGVRHAPSACPPWLPLVLLANMILYPVLAWLIVT